MAQRFPLEFTASRPDNLYPEQFLEDDAGFFWAGTTNGLFQFDGRNLVDYGPRLGLPPSETQFLTPDGEGNLLVGTEGGLYNLKNGRAHLVAPNHYTALQFFGTGAFLVERWPNEEDDFLKWVDYADFLKTGVWRPFALEVHASGAQILPDSQGSLWFGCGPGICEMSHIGHEVPPRYSLRRYGSADGLPVDKWVAAVRDPFARIWARARRHVFVAASENAPFREVRSPIELGDGLRLLMEANGAIWAAGSEGMLNDIGGRRTFIPADRFGAGQVSSFYAVFRDRAGDMWLSLLPQGMARWVGNGNVTVWGKEEGLTGIPVSVAQTVGGEYYAGCIKGLYSLSPDRSRWSIIPGTENVRFWQPLEPQPDGSLMAFSSTKVYQVLKHKARLLSEAEARRAGIASLTYRGKLIRMLPRSLTDGKAPTLELPADPGGVRDVRHDPDGNLWFATKGAGLFVTDMRGKWRQFTQADGLLQTPLQAFGTAPDGGIWIGYDNPVGFSRLAPIGKDLSGRAVLRHFRPKDHDYNEGTFFFGVDREGHVWRGTGRGVQITDGVHLDLPDWIRLTHEDGLIHNDTAQAGFFLDRDGSVWICTAGGLTRFASTKDLFHERAVRPFIASQEWTSKDHRSLRISLGVSPLALTRRVNVEYRILPERKAWIPIPELDVEVTGLSGGHHQFEARIVESRWIKAAGVAAFPFETPGGLLSWWWAALLSATAAGAGFPLRKLWRNRVTFKNLRVLFIQLRDLTPDQRDRRLRQLPPSIRKQLTDALAEADSQEDDPRGSTIAGRFAVELFLGKGGYADVYLGRDLDRNREPVAIKLIRCRPDMREWLHKRWENEQKALESLDHPGILRPRAAGVTGDGELFLVTEYIEGVPLRAAIRRDRPMTAARAWARTCEICDALEYAHRNGILHLDLKPDNIMLRNAGQRDECAMVIDFGTAVLCGPDESTEASMHVPSPADYAAPEQTGGEVSAATDVYRLALVVFEMLTGVRWRQAEFMGESDSLLQLVVLTADPGGQRARRLSATFRKALLFDRKQRTQSVIEFRNELGISLEAGQS
jgi:ligand-binding sensor domain-containing protein/predicted Ser/Thr protein kinase